MSFFFSLHSRVPKLSVPIAVQIILGITVWRVVMLVFNRTDLFVDEAQYWLWGQNLDFGYYSKPPMIGWVIRLFNEIGRSDATFWVRLAAPLFHMATALLLMRLAKLTFGREAAGWAGLTFITLPAVSLSSVLMSTDTIQLTFIAAAILLFLRLTREASIPAAAGLGLALGLAFMTKYSVLFLIPGIMVAMVMVCSTRVSLRDATIAALIGAIVVAPNLWWNLTHGAATIHHTESIANWDGDNEKSRFNLGSGLGFFAAQFGVVGPLVFATMLGALVRMVRGRSSDSEKLLVWLSLPCVALITIQAFFGGANANWAVPAYVAGTVLACGMMMSMPFWVMRTSLAIGGFIAIAIPLLTVFPAAITLANGDLAMKRYIGRSDVSRFVAETATATNIGHVVAGDRSILADLFYTLRDEQLEIHAIPATGFPNSYYQQNFPLPKDMSAPVLYVSTAVLSCQGTPAEIVASRSMTRGYRRGQTIYVQKLLPTCLLPTSEPSAGT